MILLKPGGSSQPTIITHDGSFYSQADTPKFARYDFSGHGYRCIETFVSTIYVEAELMWGNPPEFKMAVY